MIDSKDLDFSFSGLKTAVMNQIKSEGLRITQKTRISENLNIRKSEFSDLTGNPSLSESFRIDLAASIEDAITDVLVKKTLTAVKTYNIDQIIVAGGVAANKILSYKLRLKMSERGTRLDLFIPHPSLCTDNAAYIAAAAFFNYYPIDPLKLQANPNLSLS